MLGLTASCACQALSLTVQGALPAPSICHCDQCRRRTGSTFGAQLRIGAERVVQSGQARAWTRTGDSGGQATFHFCPTCGSTVWWELSGLPGQICVAAGAFGRGPVPPPRCSVYDERRPAWLVLPDSVQDIID